ACKCFSQGYWDVENVVPCGLGPSVSNITSMYSSEPPTVDGGDPTCPAMAPTAGSLWSHDTVTADCMGRFTLCYTLKAGDYNNPMTSARVVAKSCASGDYTQVNTPQSWAPLLSWNSTAGSTCYNAFFNSGGYGEMSVVGTSITCDAITDHVFQRVRYCGQM